MPNDELKKIENWEESDEFVENKSDETSSLELPLYMAR